MHTKSLAGAGILFLALAAGGPALAQDVRPIVALTASSYGAMSCSHFLGLDPGGREDLLRAMTRAAPPASLSTPVINSAPTESSVQVQLQQQMTAPALDVGQLVAACQAAPGTSSLREAYAYQNSAPGPDQMVGF
jgi:hypothetical protein